MEKPVNENGCSVQAVPASVEDIAVSTFIPETSMKDLFFGLIRYIQVVVGQGGVPYVVNVTDRVKGGDR